MDNEIPNLQEIRRRRLAWLDGSQKSKSKADDYDGDDNNTTPSNTTLLPPPKRLKTSAANPSSIIKVGKKKADDKEVIDLCEDSDDDDEQGSVSLFDESVYPVGDDGENNVVVAPPGKASSSSSATQKKIITTTSTTDYIKWKSSGGCFQTCTYNLWFGPERDGSPHAAARMKGIVDRLVQQNATLNPLWFVGFQEIVEPLSQSLVPLMQQAGYKVIAQPFEEFSFLPYGVALAIRQGGSNDDDATTSPNPTILRQGWMPYKKTEMARGFLYAHCSIPSPRGPPEECLVTTTHLESWTPQNDGATTRALQVKQVQKYCMDQFEKYPHLKTAIIMGDLNWDDERRNPTDQPLLQVLTTEGEKKKESSCLGQWKDAWLETNRNSKDKGYTYDAKLNPMLGGNLRRRFDRCMVFRRGGGNVLVGTLLIGQEALPNLTWPKLNTYTQAVRQAPTACSDHFGLVSHLSLKNT